MQPHARRARAVRFSNSRLCVQPLQLVHRGCAGSACAGGVTALSPVCKGQRSQRSHSHTQGSAAVAESAPDCARRPRGCDLQRGSSASALPARLWSGATCGPAGTPQRRNRRAQLCPIVSLLTQGARSSPRAGRRGPHLLSAARRESAASNRDGASSPVLPPACATHNSASSSAVARGRQRSPLMRARRAHASASAVGDPWALKQTGPKRQLSACERSMSACKATGPACLEGNAVLRCTGTLAPVVAPNSTTSLRRVC